jgi:hypothetical protein
LAGVFSDLLFGLLLVASSGELDPSSSSDTGLLMILRALAVFAMPFLSLPSAAFTGFTDTALPLLLGAGLLV